MGSCSDWSRDWPLLADHLELRRIAREIGPGRDLGPRRREPLHLLRRGVPSDDARIRAGRIEGRGEAGRDDRAQAEGAWGGRLPAGRVAGGSGPARHAAEEAAGAVEVIADTPIDWHDPSSYGVSGTSRSTSTRASLASLASGLLTCPKGTLVGAVPEATRAPLPAVAAEPMIESPMAAAVASASTSFM